MNWGKNRKKEKQEIEDRLWKLENPPEYEVGVVYERQIDGLTAKKSRKFVCVGAECRSELYMVPFYRRWVYTILLDDGRVEKVVIDGKPSTRAKNQTITIKANK